MTNYEAGLAAGRAEGVEAIRKLNARLADVAADRDEWKQQHENLLAMYQAEVAKRGAAQETVPAPEESPCHCANMMINQPMGIPCPDCGRPL